MFKGRTREQKAKMATAITKDISEIAVCSPDAVRIIFREMEKEDYAAGGKLSDE